MKKNWNPKYDELFSVLTVDNVDKSIVPFIELLKTSDYHKALATYKASKKNIFDPKENMINDFKKFVSYLLKNHKLTDDEEKIYLNMDLNIGDDNSEMEFHNKNYQLNDLFQVVYDGSHNYFFLIKQISDDILYRKKQSFVNNIEYYFINLSFLIYCFNY